MEQSVVNANAITLPETFGDFELLLPGELAPEYASGFLPFFLSFTLLVCCQMQKKVYSH
jgi:hypothetical protein